MQWTFTDSLHILAHFIVGLVLALFFYQKFHSRKMILAIFAVTILIDVDHLFDYFYFLTATNFQTPFWGTDYFLQSQKVFVFVHSWELVIFFGIWGWTKRLPMVLAISLAMAGHLLVDQLSYTSNPLAYFLIFRALNNFSLTWFNG